MAASCYRATPTSFPVDGQPWSTPPFEATIIGDRLYGRGVADMKSFSAIGLAFVPEFLRRGLKRPLHFALSYDEEVGCVGVRRLIADIVARGIRPAGCIVGEPTGMHLVVAHKGKKSYRCRVRGHEAHSSLTPRGVNAVQVACEIVTFLTHMARRFRDRGTFDAAYDVPYTTVHTGVIRGGTALNIVPRDCSFDFEFRHLPFDDPDVLFAEVKRFAATLLPDMHAVDAATYIEFDQLSSMPGFDTHGGSEIVELGGRCSGTHDLRQGIVRHRGIAVSQRRCLHRSSAAPGTSSRRTSPTSGCRSSSSLSARRSCRASPTTCAAHRSRRCRCLTPARPEAPCRRRNPPPRPRQSKSLSPTSGRGPAAIRAFRMPGRFAAARPGPHVLVQALTHGNEVCGAIASTRCCAKDCVRAAAR